MHTECSGPSSENAILHGARRAIRATAVLLTAIFLALLSPPAMTQPNFDIGESQFAMRCLAQGRGVAITPVNLIYDENLKLTHRFSHVDVGNDYMFIGDAWGYEAPWSTNHQPTGDIDEVKDTLGCAEYKIVIWPISFRLDLTDAHWGAGDDNSVYKILVDLEDNGVSIYVRSPGAQGTWSNAIAVQNGARYTYWDVIRATHDANYIRERTTHNDKTFHVIGEDNLLPLPSTGVTSARLDVNLSVHVDIAVPDGSTLLIEGYSQSPGPGPTTTLEFDFATGLTVYGELSTIETQVANEWILFTSSEASPAPGDWRGVHCVGSPRVWLNRASILYAINGLHVEQCDDVESYSLYVYHCIGEGVWMESSSGVHRTLRSSFHTDNGVRIEGGSDVEIHDAIIGYSSSSNGVVVLDNSSARVQNAALLENRAHGVLVSGGARVVIDSCEIAGASLETGDYWSGVYGLYNDEWITVRRSRIHEFYSGIRMEYAMVNGYESPVDPVRWSNADSLGRNCVYNDSVNLIGYHSTFEFGRAYNNGLTPHYQGGQNSIFNPLAHPFQYQGIFHHSTAWLERNFWDGNTNFNVMDSEVKTTAPLWADSSDCPGGGARLLPLAGPVHSSSFLEMYASWEAMEADSLMRVLYDARSTLTSAEAVAGFGLLWRIGDASEAESFFQRVISNSARAEILVPAYRYVAAARMRQRDWSGAVTAFQAMAGQAGYGEMSYTGAQAMAALCMHLGGTTASGRASLDTLLAAYPADVSLRTVDLLIGGQARAPVPKSAGREPASAGGYELHAAYPNPLSTHSALSFTLPETGHATLTVHDIGGRTVARLADGTHARGVTHVRFDSGDLPAGVYVLRLTAGEVTLTRMLHILK